MKIDFITFTGADNNTKIAELEVFTADHPQVEWGILLSGSKADVQRYPGRDWIEKFADSDVGERSSGHICGGLATNVANGIWDVMEALYPCWTFSNFQINLFNQTQVFEQEPFIEGLRNHSFLIDSIILQVNGKHDYMVDFDYKTVPCGIRLLYDKSGGNGVVSSSYPKPHPIYFSGYAGGYGPANITDELKKLEEAVEDKHIWIDMETKIRNDKGEFDLSLCHEVYRACEPYLTK